MRHHWTECDDTVAFYLWKFGPEGLGLSTDAIATRLTIPIGSMRMRIQNFQSLAGQGGLPNVAAQSQDIFARFDTLSEDELRAKVLVCLGSNSHYVL